MRPGLRSRRLRGCKIKPINWGRLLKTGTMSTERSKSCERRSDLRRWPMLSSKPTSREGSKSVKRHTSLGFAARSSSTCKRDAFSKRCWSSQTGRSSGSSTCGAISNKHSSSGASASSTSTRCSESSPTDSTDSSSGGAIAWLRDKATRGLSTERVF